MFSTILVQIALVFPVMSFIDFFFFLSFQDPLKDHACVSCHDFVMPLVCFNFEQLKKIYFFICCTGSHLCHARPFVVSHGLSSFGTWAQ